MKRYLSILWLFGLCLSAPIFAQDAVTTPTAPIRPIPTTTVIAGTATVERYFGNLVQGSAGLLRIVGADVVEAQALFGERAFPFFRAADADSDALYALVVADIDLQARAVPLQVLVSLRDASLQSADFTVNVLDAGYIRQNFNVPSDRAFLINPEVERNEFARLDALISAITPRKLWDPVGFDLPLDSEIVSAFGQYRVLNSTIQTRHTGWDQRAATGTPVAAMASGIVVFADVLDIRGNYVLLDHGWGIYSGYAHFSQIAVAVGQTVARGELLGLTGNTGRSSGPHLHWEVGVGGEWVDGRAFIDLWLP